jgi:hypothetical protein
MLQDEIKTGQNNVRPACGHELSISLQLSERIALQQLAYKWDSLRKNSSENTILIEEQPSPGIYVR